MFSDVHHDDNERRDRLIKKAFSMYGYAQTEIGMFVGLHPTTISRITTKPDRQCYNSYCDTHNDPFHEKELVMTRNLFFIVIVLLIALPLGTALAEPDFNPGKWEVTTETEMVGVPGMAGMIPPVTHTQCLTKGELVPQSEEGSKECKMSDIKEDGDTVSWKMTCSGKNGQMEGTGTVTYKSDTMTGEMNMIIKDAGMQIKNKISGKRIGVCD